MTLRQLIIPKPYQLRAIDDTLRHLQEEEAALCEYGETLLANGHGDEELREWFETDEYIEQQDKEYFDQESRRHSAVLAGPVFDIISTSTNPWPVVHIYDVRDSVYGLLRTCVKSIVTRG